MTIIYIGDSFCAQYADNSIKCRNSAQGVKEFSHIDMAAKELNRPYVCHGYAGASWWFSYRQFELWSKENMAAMNDLTALVFFHTNPDRLNYGEEIIPANTHEYNVWAKTYYDRDHQVWAQQAYFKELKLQWANIKTIHFLCFDIPYYDLLPGVVYTDPLYPMSLREYQEEVDPKAVGIGVDHRPNHFGEYRNRYIADATIRGIIEYSPGHHNLWPKE